MQWAVKQRATPEMMYRDGAAYLEHGYSVLQAMAKSDEFHKSLAACKHKHDATTWHVARTPDGALAGIVGWFIPGTDGRDPMIWAAFVCKAARHQGVAAELCRRALALMRQQGHKTVVIDVIVNPRLMRCMMREGFHFREPRMVIGGQRVPASTVAAMASVLHQSPPDVAEGMRAIIERARESLDYIAAAEAAIRAQEPLPSAEGFARQFSQIVARNNFATYAEMLREL